MRLLIGHVGGYPVREHRRAHDDLVDLPAQPDEDPGQGVDHEITCHRMSL
jgi:hypothetical protein